MTRPDIYYAVITLSSFTHNFTAVHVTALKRIVRYLKGTITIGSIYFKNVAFPVPTVPANVPRLAAVPLPFELELHLESFSDADWGGDRATRRSTTGAVTLLFGNFIISSCRRQPTVALSTAEAELMALTDSAKDLLAVHNVLNEIATHVNEVSIVNPSIVNVDNISTIFISENRVNNSRMRHIDIRYMFVRELIENNVLALCHVATERTTWPTCSPRRSSSARCIS